MMLLHRSSLTIIVHRELTYPGVPATLPNEIGGLTTLQSLEVIGGNSIPGKIVLFPNDLV